MRVFVFALLSAGLCGVVGAGDLKTGAVDDADMKLWYEQPAQHWQGQPLPLGNGRMGCMVFGGVEKERIQFNVDSLWTGDENLVGKKPGVSHNVSYLAEGMGFYQNFGNVYISFDSPNETTQYRRQLDLSRGVHTVSYTTKGVRFTREVFCSYPAKAIIMRLEADAPGQYSGSIVLEDAHEAQTVARGARLTFKGALGNGLEYEAQLQVFNDGGQITSEGGTLIFKECDTIVFVLASDTSYVMDHTRGWKGEHPHKCVASRIDAVSEKDYDTRLKDHIADHQSLFNRLVLDVGETDPAQAALPTDERIKARGSGVTDPDLTEMLFQYGRYLLIASSRPGALPANLQGVWNDSNRPAWHCDYHSNINVQMNYWLAEPANLSECHLPLFDLWTASIPVWRKATYIYFGEVRGFTFQTVNNVFGGCGWRWNIVGSAWHAQHFWEHYAFTQDKEFLRDTAYPFMKQVCHFWEDHLKELPDGRLVVPNGWSPEHGPREDGVSYDQQIIWDLFHNTIEATRVLGVDSAFRARITELQKRLVGPQIGKWQQLQEWMEDRDDPKDNHRHTSHLFAVYPGRQISPAQTPDFAQAASVSLQARGETGDARRSWTWPWRCAIWARLGDGDKCHHMIDGLIKYNLLPNMIATHPPMQLDGSFGITAGICEMLVQSQAGHIHLLPALPSAWPSGSVTGLCSRGGFEVDIAWDKERLTSACLRSKTGGKVELRYGDKTCEVVVPAGKDLVVNPDVF